VEFCLLSSVKIILVREGCSLLLLWAISLWLCEHKYTIVTTITPAPCCHGYYRPPWMPSSACFYFQEMWYSRSKSAWCLGFMHRYHIVLGLLGVSDFSTCLNDLVKTICVSILWLKICSCFFCVCWTRVCIWTGIDPGNTALKYLNLSCGCRNTNTMPLSILVAG